MQPADVLRDNFREGDLISLAGIFRDGVCDESLNDVTENVQHWRVLRVLRDGVTLSPVLPDGTADVESFWASRLTRIANERGRWGVISGPATH